MLRMSLSIAVVLGFCDAAQCQFQADTSSYQLAPLPSPLETLGRAQQLEIQRQQIEIQRLQIEQQTLLLQQQRQLEFERQQAELYRARQAERAKVRPKNSN